MRTADKSGEYKLNGNYFVIKTGDPIPDGAEIVEERAKPAAPENKARQAAPQTKAKGKE